MKKVFSITENHHGAGKVTTKWQNSNGNYLVSVGSNQLVTISDRHGQVQEQLQLQGSCSGFGWDQDGDILALINDRTSTLLLWDSNTLRLKQVDTSLREPATFLVWAKSSPILAIGTSKGNLLIYNHETVRKVPVLGKHNRAIICGTWSQDGLLVLGGEDKVLTVSSPEGDTIQQALLRDEPSLVQFSEMKGDTKSIGENTISLVLGKKTLFMLNMNEPDNPIELAFQQQYGDIVAYEWFGDGYMLLGFSHGYFVVISTHRKEIGTEIYQTKNHKEFLSDIAISLSLNQAASCGDNCIKLHSLSDFNEVLGVIQLDEERAVDKLEWTPDGQLLAVSTVSGRVHVFLTRLPMLGQGYNSYVAHLSSLSEVTVTNVTGEEKPIVIKAETEPSVVALGQYHVGISMNNHAWFYLLTKSANSVFEREYLGTVQKLHINAEYAAALFEGRVQLHVIEGEGNHLEEHEARLFPDNDRSDGKITCHALTKEFLIYATDGGTLTYFLLEDWQTVNIFHHSAGIVLIAPDIMGSRVIVIDSRNDAFLYNPVNDEKWPVDDVPSKVKGILWDTHIFEKGTFIIYDEDKVYTYIYCRETTEGPCIEKIGSTPIPPGQCPVLLYNGQLTCQTSGGSLTTLPLSTHPPSQVEHLKDTNVIKETLEKCFKLRRFRDAWILCQGLDSVDEWKRFAKVSLENMDLESAMSVYRHLGDVSSVWTLQSVINEAGDDKELLMGHISAMLGDLERAQALFLSSSKPTVALELRKDLLQWNEALQLASRLDPSEIPVIAREFAEQLEITGDFPTALVHYEKGLNQNKEESKDHEIICKAGIARMSLRCGDIRKGIAIAEQLENQQLRKECAEILESMKQFNEAAILYEKAGSYDKATSLYIKLKNWPKVSQLMPLVSSPRLHLQFAKTREADGYYQEAITAYLAGGDHDSAVRIYLEKLKKPEEAVKIVNESRSVDGSKMVANFFLQLNDTASAIQFLVMSNNNEEAYKLAQQHRKMDIYAMIIGDDATADDYNNIALYYKNERNSLMAGKFYHLAGDHKQALKHLLHVPVTEKGENIQLAVKVVAESDDEKLSKELTDYLLGESDGIPKDPKHLFQLYIARKQYREAAKTAIIIAAEEQNSGNYRTAHEFLFAMYKDLQNQGIKIPAEMVNNLKLLHSYILVKMHVKREDHTKAARLLIRVAKSISKFPAHIVPILTSTVIECQRAGLKTSAFNYAVVLLRPEYRDQLDVKYKKKIESIVRKPSRIIEEEPTSPCPYCNSLLGETELVCKNCQNTLPYCIVTGKHIIADDLTSCPQCNFPAIYTEFINIVDAGFSCPMCSATLTPTILKKIHDSKPFLYSDMNE